MKESDIEISVVVPVYREERSIRPFLRRAEAVLAELGVPYEIIFSLDPSPDGTEAVILEEIERNPSVRLLVFSRRFGQPVATMAGILSCRGRTCVVIDVDLQDPPELIRTMFEKLGTGYDVVCARRRSRKGETLVKRVVSWLGYAVIDRMSEVRIPRNTGDFRIMTRRVVEELRRLNESHGFLRGLVAHVGFRQTFVDYDRDERFAEKGKYNRLTGSLRIGLNGLVAFSSRPLQLMSVAGAVVTGLSLALGAWSLVPRIAGARLDHGLPATVLVVAFFSGIQLLALGLMGEYVGRIYDEVKRRPPFVLDRRVNFDDDESRATAAGAPEGRE